MSTEKLYSLKTIEKALAWYEQADAETKEKIGSTDMSIIIDYYDTNVLGPAPARFNINNNVKVKLTE